MIFTSVNELLPQTQEARTAFWLVRVQEWENIFKEEETYPTMDEEAQARSQRLYKIALHQLEA